MERVRPEPRMRVRLLDGLRGFSVLSMVAYHTMYDLVYMFGLGAPWYTGMPGYLWQQSICWVFILVAGAALHYARRPLRHALLVLGCALLLTVVTALVMPGMLVSFGVLHMLGLCMLLAALLLRRGKGGQTPLLQRVPPWAGLAVCAVLFVLFKGMPYGYIGLLDQPLLWLPRAWYSTPFLFPVGLPGPGFFSSDYFPLLPWLFLFFAGYFAWALLKGRVPASRAGRNPLEWIGRHSLPIYMLHQPVIYGLCLLLAAVGVL